LQEHDAKSEQGCLLPEHIYNSLTAMGTQQCLPLSVVQLKGKHCWKPHCCNGVVDTFGHYQSFFRVAPRQTNKQNENRTAVKYQTLELILHWYYSQKYVVRYKQNETQQVLSYIRTLQNLPVSSKFHMETSNDEALFQRVHYPFKTT
jgi:hypothetical protein